MNRHLASRRRDRGTDRGATRASVRLLALSNGPRATQGRKECRAPRSHALDSSLRDVRSSSSRLGYDIGRHPVTSLVGVAFIVIAAFSVRPWRERVPYDHLENVVHGTAATIMGLAFASSVVALVWLRWRDDHVVDRVAVAVAVVSLIAPPLWDILSGASGAIQRAMLLMWAAWYFIEVWAASAET